MNDDNQNNTVQKTGQKILSCLDGLTYEEIKAVLSFVKWNVKERLTFK